MRNLLVFAATLYWLCLTNSLQAADTTPAQPWWQAETALTAAGELEIPLTERSWWPQALSLKVGESLLIVSEFDGQGKMLIRREIGTAIPYDQPVYSHGRALLQEGKEMLVWILDDDGDMSPNSPEGDHDSDVYMVDYGADGTLDRMLDFIDEDGDNDPDIQDLRYFNEGKLRHSIMHLDLDDDSQMYPIHDYQRLIGQQLSFLIDASGDNMFYHNKYDPEARGWIPMSECPFDFHDLDGDGFSERAVRMSVAPYTFNAAVDPDYANSWERMMGPVEDIMREPGIMAVRYSADMDGGSSAERPVHYELGFHMIGAELYDLEKYRLVHEKRRPPQVSFAVPHAETLAVAEHYPAQSTGYSWREYSSATQTLEDWRLDGNDDQRWEGVFWTWQRRFMHNTGGPEQYWNVRREFDQDPSAERILYYSPVDHRLHLKGAEEGWLPVGGINTEEALGEIRMYDTNHDGYFDRWEFWQDNATAPYRKASVSDAANLELGSDLDHIAQIYFDKLLPAAVEANQNLIERLNILLPEAQLPLDHKQAIDLSASLAERLYLLDVVREALYLQLGSYVNSIVNPNLADTSNIWLPLFPEQMQAKLDAWSLVTFKAQMDAVYERGDYSSVTNMLEELDQLAKQITPPESAEDS